MKPSEVRALTDEEIQIEEDRIRRRQFELRTLAVTDKLDNPRELQHLRRDVARLLTERRTRQMKQKQAQEQQAQQAGASEAQGQE